MGSALAIEIRKPIRLYARKLPNLNHLIGDQPLTLRAAPYHGENASPLSLDATLGVPGAPQSASGQAVLLTGRNVPLEIGGHYGPKPNPQIADILTSSNLFMEVIAQGGKSGLLNAYPPGYFQAIELGRRLYSAIPLALTAAGIPLKTAAGSAAWRCFIRRLYRRNMVGSTRFSTRSDLFLSRSRHPPGRDGSVLRSGHVRLLAKRLRRASAKDGSGDRFA